MSESPRLRVPHPLVLLTGCVIIAALASYVVPAGQFDRRDDDMTGRTLVVPGTYEMVPSDPVNLFDAMVALPVGMADAASIIFLVFLIGGRVGGYPVRRARRNRDSQFKDPGEGSRPVRVRRSQGPNRNSSYGSAIECPGNVGRGGARIEHSGPDAKVAGRSGSRM